MSSIDVEILCDQMAVSPKGRPSQLDQLRHRAALIDVWRRGGASIEKAAKVLDVGCGQGDQTVALLGVDESIEVVGVDPGPPEYGVFVSESTSPSLTDNLFEPTGSPFTLSQAQGKILSSQLFKGRIQFHQVDASRAVSLYPSRHFDTATFSHCLWYYPSRETVKSAFAALKEAGVKQLAIAEWSLQISRIEATSHLLAVLAQSLVTSEIANVRLVLSPRHIRELAVEAGWTLSHEQILPSPKIKDGIWEVQAAMALKQDDSNSSEDAMEQHIAALKLSVEAVGGVTNVRTMDVWVAVFG
jgi:SAM-dependent methyltransferase